MEIINPHAISTSSPVGENRAPAKTNPKGIKGTVTISRSAALIIKPALVKIRPSSKNKTLNKKTTPTKSIKTSNNKFISFPLYLLLSILCAKFFKGYLIIFLQLLKC